jgi:hypothetical protein
MTKTVRVLFTFVLAAGALPALGQGGSMPSYEPSKRQRTSLDTCLKDEQMDGAWCVKKCQSGFRLESSKGKHKCTGLRADAKYVPPQPAWTPPEKPQVSNVQGR